MVFSFSGIYNANYFIPLNLMGYKNLAECVADLEKHGHLLRIKEEVDPYLEMAAIHLKVYEEKGPALYFEKIKGSL